MRRAGPRSKYPTLMRAQLLALLLLSACRSEPADRGAGDNIVELPQPSGPPIVQQVQEKTSAPAVATAPVWQKVASSDRTEIRLTGSGGSLLLSLACLRRPARLRAAVPTFSPIGSEDRFSLGLGNEPLILVADPTRQAQLGVSAEGPVPSNLSDLLRDAGAISAVYGAQQAGPFPPPPAQLKEAFGKGCKASG